MRAGMHACLPKGRKEGIQLGAQLSFASHFNGRDIVRACVRVCATSFRNGTVPYPLSEARRGEETDLLCFFLTVLYCTLTLSLCLSLSLSLQICADQTVGM